MRRWLVYCILAITGVIALGGQNTSGYRPKNGFVPDQKTAIAVAEAVLVPIYGEKQVASERPFSARLDQDIWTVEGHLPAGWDGGVAEVKIRKTDATVLSVTHGK
jgi:NTF2 fold immunity protein